MYCNNNPVGFVDPLGLDKKKKVKQKHKMPESVKAILNEVTDVMADATTKALGTITTKAVKDIEKEIHSLPPVKLLDGHKEIHDSLTNRISDTIAGSNDPMVTAAHLEGSVSAITLGGVLAYGSGSLLAEGTVAASVTGVGFAILATEIVWFGIDMAKGTSQGIQRKKDNKLNN